MTRKTKAIARPNLNGASAAPTMWQSVGYVHGNLPDGTQLRITLAPFTIRDRGRYNVLLRTANEYLSAKYPPGTPDEEGETVALGLRALILPSIKKAEMLGEDGAWHETQLPPEWLALETFFDSIPGALYDALTSAAFQLNGAEVGYNIAEDQKKGVSASVSWSTS